MSVAPNPNKKVLSDLKASILNPALTSHFQCWFNPPSSVRDWVKIKTSAGLGVPYDGNEELFSLSCSEASLPGSSLATHELNNDHSGVTERHVYRRQYDDRASFTFYVDHDYNLIYFFENWMSYIVNEQFSTQQGIENSNYFYRVNFPNSYKTTIFIKKFEKDYAGRVLQYRFINAYPISIDSMPVSYDSSQLLKCTVSFNYSRYVVGGGEKLASDLPPGVSQQLSNLSQEELLKLGYRSDYIVELNNLVGAAAANNGIGLEELNKANYEAYLRENS